MADKTNNNTNGQETQIVLAEPIREIITRDGGKCDALSPVQKVEYINWLCENVGVDPSLRPFDLITTQNGIRAYANKCCAELIRDARGVSITSLQISEIGNMYLVTCSVKDRTGRMDTDIGAWPKGTEPHNSLMKAVTKAKRRATLSLCRLGGLVEEAAPNEYANGNSIQQECKTTVFLEEAEKKKQEAEKADTAAKHQFAEICSMLSDVELTKEHLLQLVKSARKIINSTDISACATWVEKTRPIIEITEKGAAFKIVKD